MMTMDTRSTWTLELVQVALGAAMIRFECTDGTELWCVYHSGSAWPVTCTNRRSALDSFAGRARGLTPVHVGHPPTWPIDRAYAHEWDARRAREVG